MIGKLFKLLIMFGIIFWVIDAKAAPCKKASNQNPVFETSHGVFKVDNLNLRAGSGKEFCVKQVLRNAKGKLVLILGRIGDWRLTAYKSQKFWIHKSLITIKTYIPRIYLKPV